MERHKASLRLFRLSHLCTLPLEAPAFANPLTFFLTVNLRLSLEFLRPSPRQLPPPPPKKYLKTLPRLPTLLLFLPSTTSTTTPFRNPSQQQQSIALRITSWYYSFLTPLFKPQTFPQPQSSSDHISLTFSQPARRSRLQATTPSQTISTKPNNLPQGKSSAFQSPSIHLFLSKANSHIPNIPTSTSSSQLQLPSQHLSISNLPPQFQNISLLPQYLSSNYHLSIVAICNHRTDRSASLSLSHSHSLSALQLQQLLFGTCHTFTTSFSHSLPYPAFSILRDLDAFPSSVLADYIA